MKIIVDCHGGDLSPRANVEGAVLALRKYADLQVLLSGDQEQIEAVLGQIDADRSRIEIVHAPEVITGEEKPTDAIRLKKNSSMIRALSILREDESVGALVSTGSTGSLVAAATLRIGRIRGIRRPTFCPLLPTIQGGIVGICDSGANVEVNAEQLQQFAVLGSYYLSCVYAIPSPRVALLNVGTESEKGDTLRKEAYSLLSKTPCVNFVGNMESRDLLSGKYDLVVCDGFAGNVLIKTTEGTALAILKKLKTDIYKRKKYMLGAWFMKKLFAEEKAFFDYQNYGGSVLLGTGKTIVKGHGSSDAPAVAKCMEQAYRMHSSGMYQKIEEALSALKKQEEYANV